MDVDVVFARLTPVFFPGIPSSVQIHSGLVEAHDSAAPQIIPAVQSVLAQYQVKRVVVIGHSLGGALALLGEKPPQ